MTGKGRSGRLVLDAAIVATVAFAAFLPALQSAFTYDDAQVVSENPDLSRLFKARTYFTSDYFLWTGETTYRPVVTASYALDYLMWGKNPLGYHLANLAWHALGCVAFFLFCRTLRAGREVSLVAALLYAAHAVKSESVVGIGFREDLLCGAFYFAALALWPTGRRSRVLEETKTPNPATEESAPTDRWTRFAGAMVLYILALLSKEMALSFPILALAKELRHRPGRDGRNRRFVWEAILVRQIVVWAITLAALVLFLAFAAPDAPAVSTDNVGLLARLGAFAWVSMRYLRLLLFPYPLCVEYVVGMRGTLFEWTAAGSAAVVLLLAILAWRARRRFGAGLESLLAFYILLIPVSNLVPVFNPMAERYLTIPVAAYAWFVSNALASISRRRVRWVASAVLIAAFGALSWIRIADWRRPVRLWIGAVETGNETARIAHSLGGEIYAEGRLDEALDWFHRALRSDPEYLAARLHIGLVLYDKKEYHEAVENYEIALRRFRGPRVGQVLPALMHNNIGLAFYRLGDLDKAFDHFEQALRISPRMREAYNNRGGILAGLGRREEALVEFAKAIDSDPYWEVAHFSLAVALKESGRLDEAAAQYRVALDLKPDYLDARLGLARLLAARGRTQEAIVEYERVLRIAPNRRQAITEYNSLLRGSYELGN
ncbi:tetratricopeptide repeat protein [Candidatus Sumerlaeota bacterium]|nr:tetratricopeptide repeat protein [Candidatus Sumerlaeota bacterium]